VLFVLVLLAAALVTANGYLESNLQHPTDFGDYATVT